MAVIGSLQDWTAAAVGDFNGDGTKDVLWQHSTGALGEWLMSGGAIGMTVDLQHPMPDWTVSAVGDFNGDGTDDLLWSNAAGVAALWLMEGTTGRIAQTVDLQHPMPGWTVVAAGDLNNDGTADIVWKSEAGAVVEWFFQNGAIVQTVDLQHPMPGWNVTGTGDFNGDGVVDLYWQHSVTKQSGIWLMNGNDGTIAATLSPFPVPLPPGPDAHNDPLSPPPLLIADLNNDGTDDIVWRISGPLENNGILHAWLMQDGLIDSLATLGQAPGLKVVAVGDLDGDGKDEALWQSQYTGDVNFWPLDTDPTVQRTANREISEQPTGHVAGVGDFNGDGTTDLLWSYPLVPGASQILHRWDMQDGAPSSISTLTNVGRWTVVANGDFNNDGNGDLIWRDDDTGALTEWLMASGFIAQTIDLQHPMPDWNVVATGNFFGANTSDILWMHPSGILGLWQMQDGAVQKTVDLQHPMPGWTVIASGDFNGDGAADLLWRHNTSGTLAEWLFDLNTGLIGQTVNLDHPMPGWSILAAGDLNGDGAADLLWRNDANGQMGAWYMDDGAIAGTEDFGVSPAGLQALATGDFDADGNVDLMWRDGTDGLVNTWSIAREHTITDFYL